MEQHFRCHRYRGRPAGHFLWCTPRTRGDSRRSGLQTSRAARFSNTATSHPSVVNWINTRLDSLLLFTCGICSRQLLLALFEKDGKACPECADKRAHNLPASVPTMSPQSAHKRSHTEPTDLPTIFPQACPQCAHQRVHNVPYRTASPQRAHQRAHKRSHNEPIICPPVFPH